MRFRIAEVEEVGRVANVARTPPGSRGTTAGGARIAES